MFTHQGDHYADQFGVTTRPGRPPRALRALPPDWTLVRSGPLRGTDRWLLVGPGGGALVTFLPYRGRVVAGPEHVSRSGRRTTDAGTCRDAGWLMSAWLTDLADAYVPANPVLTVPSGARPMNAGGPPIGYDLIRSSRLPQWLLMLPQVMPRQDARQLARVATTSD